MDAVVVDEVQDLGPQQVRLLAAIAGHGADALTLIGDGGQRIYARRLSLRTLGIEVRGRSHTLRVNYRTAEQIRHFADRALGVTGDDLDGGVEPRRVCRRLMRGPNVVSHGFPTAEEQHRFIVGVVRRFEQDGRSLDEIAVLSRTNSRLDTIARVLTVVC